VYASRQDHCVVYRLEPLAIRIRVLLSNGRVESDLLDRIEEALAA